MTLYLKYRPQRFSDLDLNEVSRVLTKYLETGNLPHAWLFSGPRGTGKTSSARILAKAVNCEKKSKEPCNKCEMCEAITAGTAVDVVEIDAASNRGIEEIRELREKVKLAPMKAKVKVYIIDEVHMLTTEAANALLKTLEEPPENTMFILCTTDPSKLPETVLSRCTRVVFRKPSEEEIVSRLEKVAKEEGQKLTLKDLKEISRASRGSFRDAIKILEQVILAGGDVPGVIGLITEADPGKLLQAVANGKKQEALAVIADLEKLGVNFRRFTEMLVEELRTELLGLPSPQNGEKQIAWLEQLGEVYDQMRTAAVPQLPLEIWIIRNTASNPLAARVESQPTRQPEITKEEKKFPEEVKMKPAEVTVASGKGKYKLEDLTRKWAEVMKAVRPKNHSVEALLRSTKPTGFDGEKLELEVFYKFHKEKLETEKCRLIVEEAVSQVFGEDGIKLFLKLGQKVVKTPDEVSAAGVGEDVIKAAEEIFGVQAI